MDESTLRARVPPVSSPSEDNSSTAPTSMFQLRKPQNFRYGPVMELVRLVLFLTFFISFTVMIHTGQYIGAPLYLINQNYYYAWMAFTKQQYAIFLTLLTQWFAPTPVIVSGDASVQGHLRKTADGRLATLFPERVVVMSNHQLYTDWLYLWWIAYTSKMHPYLYIVLKDTFKYLPILGPAMKFYGFIFMSRKWATDQSRMAYRLKKLTASHSGPMSGSAGLDPMWFVMYPEGTNLSGRTRKRSAAWAEKAGLEDMRHLLLPRSTGLFYVLSELKHTIDYVYDITVAYGGIPPGEYGQDIFGLRSTYIAGHPPHSVNIYIRRYPISSIPLSDAKAFELWILDIWRSKDDLLGYWSVNGRFPESPSLQSPSGELDGELEGKDEKSGGWIETEIRLSRWTDVGLMFVISVPVGVLGWMGWRLWEWIS